MALSDFLSAHDFTLFAATRAIRRGNGPRRAAPIIASVFPEDAEACRAAGMNDFVSRPISKAILVDALSRAMALQEKSLKVSGKV